MIEPFPIADPEVASQSWSRWFGKIRAEFNKNFIVLVNTPTIANVLTLDLGLADFSIVGVFTNTIKFLLNSALIFPNHLLHD